MCNHKVTIGNTTAADFAGWLDASYSALLPGINATIVDATGFYGGTRERCVVVTLYGLREHETRGLLARYGKDHPGEECFGLSRAPDSVLVPNQHWYTDIVAPRSEIRASRS